MSTSLILFAKHPEPGKVKTRLIPALGAEGAAALAAAFLRDSIDLGAEVAADERTLAYSPPESREAMAALCPEGWRVEAQSAGDLGDRITAAVHNALARGRTRVVIIGSDAPHIPEHVVSRAFDALGTHDLVLGPAIDGGFYLIGLRVPPGRLLDGVAWGEDQVFARTETMAMLLGMSTASLDMCRDIDTPADLEYLSIALAAVGPECLQHTRQAYAATVLAPSLPQRRQI
jgi:uncharacterized protein